MTQFRPLAFEEGVDLTVQSTSGKVYADVSAADVQTEGVMVEYLEGTVATRSLIPWSRIAVVSQNI